MPMLEYVHISFQTDGHGNIVKELRRHETLQTSSKVKKCNPNSRPLQYMVPYRPVSPNAEVLSTWQMLPFEKFEKHLNVNGKLKSNTRRQRLEQPHPQHLSLHSLPQSSKVWRCSKYALFQVSNLKQDLLLIYYMLRSITYNWAKAVDL